MEANVMREEVMKTMGRLFRLWMLLVVISAAVACGSLESSPEVQWIQIPIVDFQSVAGKWEGIMISAPRMRRDDWVQGTIREDGTYEFASYRTIGVFQGSGTFTVSDGKARATGERGTITLTLYTAEGGRQLRAIGVAKDGNEYSADLTPAR
jgi:hypothetical protein